MLISECLWKGGGSQGPSLSFPVLFIHVVSEAFGKCNENCFAAEQTMSDFSILLNFQIPFWQNIFRISPGG